MFDFILEMDQQRILAIVQSDLQLICSMRSALEDSGLGVLSIARNSQEAILYLRGVGIYGDRERHPLPGVVLLDCTNPDCADLEVLAWMRENPRFRETPVILLCNEEQRQLRVSCALDSFSFFVDRSDLSELADAVCMLEAAQIGQMAAAWAFFDPSARIRSGGAADFSRA